MGDTAQWTGSETNPKEDFKMRKTTLQFGARNAKFSNNDQLQTDDHFTLPGGARVDPGYQRRKRNKLHYFLK